MKEISTVLDEITPVMKRCGEIMLEAKNENIEEAVSAKEGRHNLVTEYDKRIQGILKEELQRIFPEAAFVGEENNETSDISAGFAFIVDPIDGTSNFIKNMDRSCISVGITKDASPVAGLIYDPYKVVLYRAERGKGACANGRPIHVSGDALDDGLVDIGTAPYNASLTETTMKLIGGLFGRCIDIRRFGSAALDLCDVATGKAVLYCEPQVAPWDICAGVVIVTEAGGTCTDLDGKPLQFVNKTSICAGNGVAKLPPL